MPPCYDVSSESRGEEAKLVNRNLFFFLLGSMAAVIAVLGYNLYQEKKEPQGVEINIGPGGVSIEKK